MHELEQAILLADQLVTRSENIAKRSVQLANDASAALIRSHFPTAKRTLGPRGGQRRNTQRAA